MFRKIEARRRPFAAIGVIALLSAAVHPALADEGHDHGKAVPPAQEQGHRHGANAGRGHGDPAIGKPGKASAATRTVNVVLQDNAFEPAKIEVKPGETVRFVLTNKGQLLHEFNIGTAAMHAEHQKEMAVMMDHGMLTPTGVNHQMMKMDHSKMGMKPMKHDDPNSVLVEPGKTKELVWQFPNSHNLEFACNIPGHYDAGMVGNIVNRN